MDNWIAKNINLWHNAWLDNIMIAVSDIGSPVSIMTMAVILSCWYYKYGQKENFRLILFAMAGGWALVNSLKFFIARSRPIGGLLSVAGYSFPSGHATMATIFFLLLVYIYLGRYRSLSSALTIIGIAAAAIILVGFSRVYLGVHWATDVLGGIVVGSLWLLAIVRLERLTAIHYDNFKTIVRIPPQ